MRRRVSLEWCAWVLLILKMLNVSDANTTATRDTYSFTDDLDGGFSSLDGMLQWAIGHSDPTKLKDTAESVSPSDLEKKQIQIKDLMETLKTPSDAQMMKIAIHDLNNSSLSLEDLHHALEEILFLVESIDNANDMNKHGGLDAVLRQLSHPDPNIRKISAWVVGTASQNNPVVQKQVLDHGALTRLIKLVKSSFVEESIKAFYAVSALIRSNQYGQELFFLESGDSLFQAILSNSSVDIRLCRKALFLMADLAESQMENPHKAELPFFSDKILLKSVDRTATIDLDLKEKALVAIKNLLRLRSTEAMVFKEFCGLEGALESMRQQFQDLKSEHKNYAMDLENLRIEVELIFHKKLGNVIMRVPT